MCGEEEVWTINDEITTITIVKRDGSEKMINKRGKVTAEDIRRIAAREGIEKFVVRDVEEVDIDVEEFPLATDIRIEEFDEEVHCPSG